jgi:N-acetylglucosaminyldiphosphoundecaprenol N-acetyl-beta-D-mannosaminyltransferase
MIDRGKRNLLGIYIDAIDMEASVGRIAAAAKQFERCTVSALAVHGVMEGVLDRNHAYRLNHMDIVVPDGQPVRWGLNLLHRVRLRHRVYGPSLMLNLCRVASSSDIPVYLYGSEQETLTALEGQLTRQFDNLSIAGSRPSQFGKLSLEQKSQIVREIRESGAQIVFVGLGCPRQEIWAFEFGDALNIPVVAVGAAFDFHAGLKRQAPEVMQRLGLEWFFRLLQEPKRLWRRYLYLNPIYSILVLIQWLGIHKFNPGRAVPPEEELLPG